MLSSVAADPPPSRRHALVTLPIAALGVVFGDIGTSPLYAIRECFHGEESVPIVREHVLGVLSLIFWALMILVSIKYLLLIMRANIKGEGGVLALLGLILSRSDGGKAKRPILIGLALFAAALLYGDGVLTPAISVLSAVEGISVEAKQCEPFVVPIALVILLALFYFQKQGTGGIGAVFGPVMILWFGALAILGIRGVAGNAEVLWALSPYYGVRFLVADPAQGFLVLGSVFLAVTGAEAIYSDMGHFGRRPIGIAWFGLVFPALFLNYLGQGALLLAHPEKAASPFYSLAPEWGHYPLVILATAATVVASQAMISSAFSLTQQAIQLGYAPRLEVDHTSAREIGQVYVPGVNWALMVVVAAVVIGFGRSTELAAAYGIAVTGTMLITTSLAFVLVREIWGWKTITALVVMGPFFLIELTFLSSNLLKVAQGGWLPLAVGAMIYTLMLTWKRGREILGERLRAGLLPFQDFLEDVRGSKPHRVKGTAVFMTGSADGTPHVLLHHIKHNQVIHKQVVMLTVLTGDVPRIASDERVSVTDCGNGFFRVLARYGYMERPDIPEALDACRRFGVETREAQTTYYLGRETLVASGKSGLSTWRVLLFAFMTRNSQRASTFFRLPPNRVVELGIQVEL